MSNIVPFQPRALAIPDANTVAGMLEMAKILVQSNLLPSHIKTPQAAFFAMQKGAELGIPPTHALGNIIVINNKPTCNAQLMAALIYRDHGGGALEYVESTPERCTIRYHRPGGRQGEYSYTIEDARRAGLNTDPWKKYPQAMLRARCVSAVAVMVFPDSVAGMYTPEEMGANVTVDRDGEIIVLDTEPPPPRREAPSVVTASQAQIDAIYAATNMADEWVDRQCVRIYNRAPIQLSNVEADAFVGQLRSAVSAQQHVNGSAPAETIWVVSDKAGGASTQCSIVVGDNVCGRLLTDSATQTAAFKLDKLHERGLPASACLCDAHAKAWLTAGCPLIEVQRDPFVDATPSSPSNEAADAQWAELMFEADEPTPAGA